MLLGPAGAIIGGLSGSSKTTGTAIEEQQIRSVTLTIRLADRAHPLVTYKFYQAIGQGMNANAIRPYLNDATRFHALLLNRIEDGPAPKATAAAA